jgi:hypothetical protein
MADDARVSIYLDEAAVAAEERRAQNAQHSSPSASAIYKMLDGLLHVVIDGERSFYAAMRSRSLQV